MAGIVYDPIVEAGPVGFLYQQTSAVSCKLTDNTYVIVGGQDDGTNSGIWCIVATVVGKTLSLSPLVQIDTTIPDFDGHRYGLGGGYGGNGIFVAALDATHFVVAYDYITQWDVLIPGTGFVGATSTRGFLIVGTASGGTPVLGSPIEPVDPSIHVSFYDGALDAGPNGAINVMVSLNNGLALFTHAKPVTTFESPQQVAWRTVDASGSLSSPVLKTVTLDPAAVTGKPGTIWTSWGDYGDPLAPNYFVARVRWTGSDAVVEGGLGPANYPNGGYPQFDPRYWFYDEAGGAVGIVYKDHYFSSFNDTYVVFMDENTFALYGGFGHWEDLPGASQPVVSDTEIGVQVWWSTRTFIGDWMNLVAWNLKEMRAGNPNLPMFPEESGGFFLDTAANVGMWPGTHPFSHIVQPIGKNRFLTAVVGAFNDSQSDGFLTLPTTVHVAIATVTFYTPQTPPLRRRQRDDAQTVGGPPLRARTNGPNSPTNPDNSLRRGGRNTYV